MTFRKQLLVGVMAGSLALGGCQSTGGGGVAGMGQQESWGTGIGAVAGGLLGGLLGGKNALAFAALGAVGGGLIGNRIGHLLDERDAKALADRQRAAVASADGQAVNWSSDHNNGVHATLAAGNTRMETRAVQVAWAPGVNPTEILPIGKRGKATAPVAVFASPNTASPVLTSLPAGSHVTVTGQVPGKDWLAIAKEGKVIGFADMHLIQAAPPSSGAHTVTARGMNGQPAVQVALSKSANDVKVPSDYDQIAAAGGKVTTVNAPVACRTVTTTLTVATNAPVSDQADACQTPTGEWEMVSH